MRPYAGEADVQPITNLLNLCDAVDQQDDNYDAEDLRLEFSDPQLDPTRDLQVWADDDGRLVGFAQTWIPAAHEGDSHVDGFLYFRVHPEARGGALERDILAWGEERLREVGRERGLPVKMRTGACEHVAYWRGFFEVQGFTPQRYFFTMRRPLDQPIPEPQFPAGYTLRHVTNDADVEQWTDLFNLSFIDHWNFHPTTVEARRHWLQHPNYLPERDLVAIAPDGTFAAFCFCDINQADNTRNARNEGWIATLGTRRGYRKIGLGRALLLAGMHKLKADGVTTAKLGVDAESPTGALGLYESVGFERELVRIVYGKEVKG
jgi:GNAT superfamily N-acetyltransferase